MDAQLKRAILLLFIAGPPVLLWLHAFSGIGRYVAMRAWPRTTAIVQDARVSGPLTRGYVPLEVLAAYEATGKAMKAWCVVPMQPVPRAQRRSGPPVANDYLGQQFAVGRSIEIFYNPGRPGEAHYLMPSLTSSFVGVAAGFVWLMVCAAALWL